MPKVEKNEANAAKCSCPTCPSYNDCAKSAVEAVYCAAVVGKSVCAYAKNGCVCGSCPVHGAYKLKNGYYCLNGSAEQIG